MTVICPADVIDPATKKISRFLNKFKYVLLQWCSAELLKFFVADGSPIINLDQYVDIFVSNDITFYSNLNLWNVNLSSICAVKYKSFWSLPVTHILSKNSQKLPLY